MKMKKPTYIIAEAGINHNGSEDLAYRLIDVAAKAGADAIKFQTFKAHKLVTKYAKKAPYQILKTQKNDSQFAMLHSLELTEDTQYRIRDYCYQAGITFLSSA